VVVDPDVGAVRTDKVKLNQCLLNLLSNAAKFTKQGTVTLSIAALERGNGPWIAFAVSDTGIGMSPDQLSKLFAPFSQADASTTRQYGGTGLGLSISKAFAELLGGSLAVESAKGKGTTFRLLIPADLQVQERAKDEPTQSNADIKKGVAA
jgi:signal transduction histidine kinase